MDESFVLEVVDLNLVIVSQGITLGAREVFFGLRFDIFLVLRNCFFHK